MEKTIVKNNEFYTLKKLQEMNVPPEKFLYLCDGKACKNGCKNPQCHHTRSIENAATFNKPVSDIIFQKISGFYWEVDLTSKGDRNG